MLSYVILYFMMAALGMTAAPSEKKAAPTYMNPVTANYTKAKSISSDQYFGCENNETSRETKERMAKFGGSASISSAQYFDRDESDMKSMCRVYSSHISIHFLNHSQIFHCLSLIRIA